MPQITRAAPGAKAIALHKWHSALYKSVEASTPYRAQLDAISVYIPQADTRPPDQRFPYGLPKLLLRHLGTIFLNPEPFISPADPFADETKGGSCLTLILPVGEGCFSFGCAEVYASEGEALEALEGFVAALDMGCPYVVGTGDTVFAIWRFVEAAPFKTWCRLWREAKKIARRCDLKPPVQVIGRLPCCVAHLMHGAAQEPRT